MKRLLKLVLLLTLSFSMVAFANEATWESAPGHHNQSILLVNGETNSTDTIYNNARGEILSMAMADITNEQNGTLYVCVDTFTHIPVDEIYQTVFLDKWDEKKEDWYQIGYWEFERSKEEVNGELVSYTVEFDVTDCEVNKYYRIRGLHMAVLNGDRESFATETHGVLLTDIY